MFVVCGYPQKSDGISITDLPFLGGIAAPRRAPRKATRIRHRRKTRRAPRVVPVDVVLGVAKAWCHKGYWVNLFNPYTPYGGMIQVKVRFTGGRVAVGGNSVVGELAHEAFLAEVGLASPGPVVAFVAANEAALRCM